ncbi:MAG: DUF4381 domain-containing protein [Pseudomonadota bacterium]
MSETQTDTLIDLLNRLEPVHVPDPVSYSPSGPGWSVVAAIVVVAALGAAFWAWQRWRHNEYRREAARALDGVSVGPAPPAERLAATASILRRTALTAFPRGEIASLTDAAWIAFLNRTAAVRFDDRAEPLLRACLYGREAQPDPADVEAFIGSARTWIRTHRTGRAQSDA